MSTELEVLTSVEIIGCIVSGARCVLKYDVYCVRAESLNAMRAVLLSVQILICTQLEAFVKDSFSVLEGCVLGVT